jgi:hypothetical protein
LGRVYGYLADYIVLPEPALLVVSAWVMASYLAEVWDRFPHLAVTSPAGRCGKTRLLELLQPVGRKAELVVSISPASLYRTIALEMPTLLLDEAQSLNRRGTESTESLYELFCGGISKAATVSRCVGPSHEPARFPIYCPKIVALIGKLQGVLADRCLPVLMRRKTKEEEVKKHRVREAEAKAKGLAEELARWAQSKKTRGRVKAIYDRLDSFDIDNDRMAELLLPLQAVLLAEFGEDEANNVPLQILRQYAEGLEEQDHQLERESPGVKLLLACREMFEEGGLTGGPVDFLPTKRLLEMLLKREEEGWKEFNKGQPITREAVARLLSEYDIRPSKEKTSQQVRGYFRVDFKDAWARYLPPARPYPENPSIPSDPSNPSREQPSGGFGLLDQLRKARGEGGAQ